MKKKVTVGILAHVDAGKTTLAEAMLYAAGVIRKPGRVDYGNTALDTHELERQRGITIFSSAASFSFGDTDIYLLDTPGHVDFSAETERTLRILDAAVLVISATDGVQAHTQTLWKLLEYYNIPVFIFVTKTDLPSAGRSSIMNELVYRLCSSCIDFSSDVYSERCEALAMCREDILDRYLSDGTVCDEDITSLIASRSVFPCLFGSGLKSEGINEFLLLLDKYLPDVSRPNEFGARVFKIAHDKDGGKLSYIKITGGSLKVRDTVLLDENEEKITQLKIFKGSKAVPAEIAYAGDICVITGADSLKNGQGLGIEADFNSPVLEPVMNYGIVSADNDDIDKILSALRIIESEEPLLKVNADSRLKEIHVGLMGEVQAEILKSVMADRFGLNISLNSSRVMYKETINGTVEGVGHYEPLRHYSEVHLLIESLPRGTGIIFENDVSRDTLDINWQRLIMTHLAEKQHLGVLTGSPLTDVKITLAAARAHLKHTEGGDFRQSVYRAVRQGLMQAESVLLEPFYSFRLEIPSECLGRAINDINLFSGTFDEPVTDGEFSILKGKAPVTEMNGYASLVASYSSGRGRLFTELSGYYECHDPEKVIAAINYDPEADLENTPDSVFCAHGAGFGVKWNKVTEYMHLESCLKKEKNFVPLINRRNFHIDDKELQAIMDREFGKVSYEIRKPKNNCDTIRENKSEELRPLSQCLIVDGYNLIFAWEELKSLAANEFEQARTALMDLLCNYSAFTGIKVVLVFDAYRIHGGSGEKFNYKNISVVYTKEHELADVYISKLISEIGKNYKVRVVTSDNLIQLSAVRFGILRLSAAEFEKEVSEVQSQISEELEHMRTGKTPTRINDLIN